MERVLQELDKTDSLPRTERKLSRAVSFAPNARAHIEEPEKSVLSLSNRLMSSFDKDVAVVVKNTELADEDSGAGIGNEKE